MANVLENACVIKIHSTLFYLSALTEKKSLIGKQLYFYFAAVQSVVVFIYLFFLCCVFGCFLWYSWYKHHPKSKKKSTQNVYAFFSILCRKSFVSL